MKLSEVCLNIVDCPHSTAPDEGSGYALVRTPNIGKGRFNLEGVHRISEAAYKKRCARITPTVNDLILAREAPAGNIAIIKENMEPLALGQRTVLIRPNPEKVCPDFLVYYLLAPQQQNELLGRATGATVAHVNIPIINNLPVSLPPLETQQKIAGILSAYDDLIENNRKQIKLLEEAAQKLYKEWFVKLNFPGHENVKIVDGVPEGWKKGSVLSFEYFKQINPAVQKFEGEKTYYATADVNGTSLDGIGEKVTYSKRPSRASVQPAEKSVWFARMSNSYKILCCYGRSESLAQNSIISSGFAGFKSEDKYFGFIFTTIASDFFNQEKNRYATGATQVSLTNEGLRRIIILVPTEDLMIKFSSIVNPLIKKMEVLKEQIKILQSSRDKLLPKLMNGDFIY
ncbi:MAG TPA: restriction endonuclease subunit S [Treponema sp.]|nr:restriction endonuclease subunit S [Treponema sp.]